MMTYRYQLPALCCALVIALVPAAPAEAQVGTEAEACTAICEQCGVFCEDCYRVVDQPYGWNGTHQNYTYPCADAPCPQACVALQNVPEPAELDRLQQQPWDLLSGGIYAASDESYTYDPERNVLLFKGCSGGIVAHVTLSKSGIYAPLALIGY